MSSLPHVVWDMGGILYHYFTELMVEIGVQRGWPLDRIPLGPTGPSPDPDYQRLLEGGLDEPEYLLLIESRLERYEINFDPPTELAAAWRPRPETWATIKAIRGAGHRQAVLTNDATRWLGDRWWETWEGVGWFDTVVDVLTIGVFKPEPQPYLAVAEQLEVPPEECLFVDDLPVNCRGAEAVGMESHLFDITDPRGSLDSLMDRLSI